METTETSTKRPNKQVFCGCNTKPLRPHTNVIDNNTGESVETGDVVYGRCGATTGKFFAPGHDAKIKGLLIKLVRAGKEYIFDDGGWTACDPREQLANHGWLHFLGEVGTSDKGTQKLVKADRKKNRPKFCKVGRWIYETVEVAPINEDGKHDVAYRTKDGEVMTAFVKPENLFNKKPE